MAKLNLRILNYPYVKKVLNALELHYDVFEEEESGQIIFKSIQQYTNDEKIELMANCLFRELKDRRPSISSITLANNTDQLGIDEFDELKEIVKAMVKYYR